MLGSMKLDQVAQTGRLTAAMRARESLRPDRLFDDPYAERLAGGAGDDLLAEFGDNSTISVRTKWLDDKLVAVRPEQLVIVAAGMDARGWRLDVLCDTVLFELDRPEVLQLKEELIGEPSIGERHSIGVDLAADWPSALLAAGFDAARPTVWTVEGLTQYLPADAVHRLVDGITRLSAADSHLLVDFVGQSLLDSEPMKPMLDRFAEMGSGWQFGTDEPEELLAGWACEVSMFDTVGNSYGRWGYPEVPRGTPGIGHGYLVHARR
jgi:methyltransferase (TIGR00027 family)